MVIIAGHYDTKHMDPPFVGLNDGGSSAAFLLEMASRPGPKKELTQLIFALRILCSGQPLWTVRDREARGLFPVIVSSYAGLTWAKASLTVARLECSKLCTRPLIAGN